MGTTVFVLKTKIENDVFNFLNENENGIELEIKVENENINRNSLLAGTVFRKHFRSTLLFHSYTKNLHENFL